MSAFRFESRFRFDYRDDSAVFSAKLFIKIRTLFHWWFGPFNYLGNEIFELIISRRLRLIFGGNDFSNFGMAENLAILCSALLRRCKCFSVMVKHNRFVSDTDDLKMFLLLKNVQIYQICSWDPVSSFHVDVWFLIWVELDMYAVPLILMGLLGLVNWLVAHWVTYRHVRILVAMNYA